MQTMINYAQINTETNSRQFNVRDEYKNNAAEENIAICNGDRLDFALGLYSVTGELNIGMSIRSALLLGAKEIYLFGRKKYDGRSLVGAGQYINIESRSYNDPLKCDSQLLEDLKSLPYTVVLVEHGGYELASNNSEFYNQFPSPPIFIMGSESHGLPEAILAEPSFYKISIPQRGVLRSYNVSAAANIIMWDWIKTTSL